MNKLYGYLALVGVAIIVIVIGISCGKPPSPGPGPGPGPGPNPDPVVADFSIQGKTVRIEGKLKPATTVSYAEAKRSMQIAADTIDRY